MSHASSYNVATGKNTPSAPVSIASHAIFLDYALESHGLMNGTGTLIEKDDKEVYLAYSSSFPRKPAPTDYIIDATGNKWRIITTKVDSPDGVNIIKYTIQVRR